MGEGTWEYVGGAILILVVFILIVLIAFPMLRDGKSDVMDIYKKVFDLERPGEEVLNEKSAVDAFNSFLDQLNKCLKLGESDCTCDFDLSKLGDYKIEIDETDMKGAKITLIGGKGERLNSETHADLVFGIADGEGCGYVNFDEKTGYRTTNLNLEGNNVLLEFVNKKGKDDEKKFPRDIPKIYVDKLPKNNQLCFIIDGYDNYEDKLSCKDVSKKLEVEKRGDEIIKILFNQLDTCWSKGNKDCTCSLDSLGLEDNEKLIFRIGESEHEIHLAKNGFPSEPTIYPFNFKTAEGNEQKKECKNLGLSSVFYHLGFEEDKFYLKKATTSLGDPLEKDHELYISSTEDKNTICFLKKGGEVPPAC